jgi:membrane-bound metal-dependent hydrolase YbcI (DUF457 family)
MVESVANYATHISGSAISSGLLASSLSIVNIFSATEIVIIWIVGAISGILPDIDSDSSKAHQHVFTFLGILASFGCVTLFRGLPLFQMWAMMFSCFVLVKFVVMKIFASVTHHRGLFHSILAAILFALSGAWLSLNYWTKSPDFAWAIGISILCGYLTHLFLDECYSVDLSNNEIKRSFGTALKPLSLKNSFGSIIFAAASFFFYTDLPTPQKLESAIFSESNKGLARTSIKLLKKGNNVFLTEVELQLLGQKNSNEPCSINC